MLRWTDEDHVVVGTTTFLTMGDLETIDAAALLRLSRLRSTPDRLVLLKTRRMIGSYLDALERLRPRNVLELGIFQGGSVALVAETVRPERLVAIELEAEPVAALEDWIERWDGPTRIQTYYGINQTDAERLVSITDRDFNGPLDLIIDDASHLMPETRLSFNVLFPRLRPGGVYLVEDWSWAHHMDPASFADRTPLTLLLLELVFACTHVPDLIESVEVGPDIFTIRRGPATLGPHALDLTSHFDERARRLVPDLGRLG